MSANFEYFSTLISSALTELRRVRDELDVQRMREVKIMAMLVEMEAAKRQDDELIRKIFNAGEILKRASTMLDKASDRFEEFKTMVDFLLWTPLDLDVFYQLLMRRAQVVNIPVFTKTESDDFVDRLVKEGKIQILDGLISKIILD